MMASLPQGIIKTAFSTPGKMPGIKRRFSLSSLMLAQ
jgi:hypothetical protein